MWTKILIYTLLSLLVCPLFSAESKKTGTSTEKKLKEQHSSKKKLGTVYNHRMFDPTIPKLSKEQVNGFFRMIDRQLMNYDWPSSVSQARKSYQDREKNKDGTGPQEEMLSPSILKNYLFIYKRLTLHPDLEEVTKTKKEYFNAIGRVLVSYVNPVTSLHIAATTKNEDAYKRALKQINDVSDALDKAIRNQKKYLLTNAELRQVRNANIARRTVEIEALKKKLGLDKQSQKKNRNR